MFRRFLAMLTVGAIFCSEQSAFSCGFNESAEKVATLRESALASQILLFARVTNVYGDYEKGATDLIVLKSLKSDVVFKGKKVIRIPRYIPIPDAKNPPQLLVFGEISKGEPDFFKGVPADEALIKYVEGAMEPEAKDRDKVMRYAFDYLDHRSAIISEDAYAEFIKSSDPDIRKIGRSLNAHKLRLWLQDEKTPPGRLRLYAFLLAQCGGQQDVDLFKKLLDKLVEESSPPLVDGIFTAYICLSPTEGWEYACRQLKLSDSKFIIRYSVLRATRYFFTTQPGIVPEKALLEAVRLALGQSDMADIPVDYLRQWKYWNLTQEVLALSNKKGFETPLIQRSILRYALHCPDPQAIQYILDMRKSDPKFVEAVEKE